MKKRKSAPVLNEICEERELEENAQEPSFYQANFHPSGRHSISTSSPTTHPMRHPSHSGPKGDPGDPPKSKSPTFLARTGKIFVVLKCSKFQTQRFHHIRYITQSV